MTNEEIKRQELLFKQGQQQWKQIKDIGKLLGRILKQAKSEEENNGYNEEEEVEG